MHPSNFNEVAETVRTELEQFFKELKYRSSSNDSPFLKLEQSLDLLQSYTTSSNTLIPVEYILTFLDNLEMCKKIASTKNFKEFNTPDVITLLWQTSLPLLQVRQSHPNYDLKIDKVSFVNIKNEADTIFKGYVDELTKIKEEIVGESSRLQKLHEANMTDIKTASDVSANRVMSITDNFIDDINHKINDIEQSSIKRMTNQSSERLKELKNVQDGALQSFNGAVDDRIDSISERINAEISTFESKKEALEKVIGAIGGASMSHEHKAQAKQEFRAFVFFQLTGFSMLLLAIASTLTIFGTSLGFTVPMLDSMFSVVELSAVDTLTTDVANVSLATPETSNLVWFLQRISLVILLTTPGIFLLKEATIHRQKENLYRQRGIQLAAIEPFIDEFPDDEKVKIKKELVKNFFTFHDGKAGTKHVPDFIRDMKEAVGIAKSINGQAKTVSQRFNRKAK